MPLPRQIVELLLEYKREKNKWITEALRPLVPGHVHHSLLHFEESGVRYIQGKGFRVEQLDPPVAADAPPGEHRIRHILWYNGKTVGKWDYFFTIQKPKTNQRLDNISEL